MYKILIVDDHLVVRAGIALILKEEFQDLKIENAENFFETITILKEHAFDLIILDINIPGSKNTKMIEDIKAIQPAIKILIFSAYEENEYAFKYILSGANGYLNKLCTEKKIMQAITTILEGKNYISVETADRIIEAAIHKTTISPLGLLSRRELEIAELLVAGNGNLEIANTLNLQMSTVSTYKTRVFEKLKINNIVDLIHLFKAHAS